ncbi:MAG: hypothetical protein ABIL58_24280 [Pseudomonadota bacterium]
MKDDQFNEVDVSMIRMFLQMTPEARILSNEQAALTILELRNALANQKAADTEPERPD